MQTCYLTTRRLRNYKVLTPAGAYVPTAMPGMADLTLKMKKIDPDAGSKPLELPCLVSDRKKTTTTAADTQTDTQTDTRPCQVGLSQPSSTPINHGLPDTQYDDSWQSRE